MTAEQQEIFELKKLLSWQQVEMNVLRSNLDQCQFEKEELEAEKAVLIEERIDQDLPADTRHVELKRQLATQQQKIKVLESNLQQCLLENEKLEAEKTSLIQEKTNHQLKIDAKQAELTRENARLQVVSDIMRKSFKKSYEDARKKSESDKQTIKTLEQENKILQEKILLNSSSPPHKIKKKQQQEDKWQAMEEFRFSGNNDSSSQGIYKLLKHKRQHEQQLPRKLSTRETEFNTSNHTASTFLMDDSQRSLFSSRRSFRLDGSQRSLFSNSQSQSHLLLSSVHEDYNLPFDSSTRTFAVNSEY